MGAKQAVEKECEGLMPDFVQQNPFTHRCCLGVVNGRSAHFVGVAIVGRSILSFYRHISYHRAHLDARILQTPQ